MSKTKLEQSISDKLGKNKEKLFEVMDGVLSKKASPKEVKQACKESKQVLKGVQQDIKKLANS